ncbi:hypothetical protein [Demequina sp. NBRC 110055]|uniref:hypothetical protein n=1 Tax=Demequina sp. NBRC 110055 TaxID=1570344 RepID=UPI000A00F16E|nr:hypothetical protein [Demequina sp. NBRC 110055]
MRYPTVRTVAVSAGFLGLTMIVAGTATAMAGAHDGGAVGSGITLTQEEGATPSPTPSQVDADDRRELLPGTPIEIGADPVIECDVDGTCGPDTSGTPAASETSDAVGAQEVSAQVVSATTQADTAPSPVGTAGQTATLGSVLAACDLPERPDVDREATRAEHREAMHTWKDAFVAAAKDCGVEFDRRAGSAEREHLHAAIDAFAEARRDTRNSDDSDADRERASGRDARQGDDSHGDDARSAARGPQDGWSRTEGGERASGARAPGERASGERAGAQGRR